MRQKQQFTGNKPTAILVDGGFFLHRYKHCYKDGKTHDAKTVAQNMYTMLLHHVENESLYRILYYDCSPFSQKAHNPVTGKNIDFSKTEIAQFRQAFFNELKKLRKVAIRLGKLQDKGGWIIRPNVSKNLLNKAITIDDLDENDVYYNIVQKGVDIKIGLDIASLAYKQLVCKIILVSGDSDFVPAAKLARREGIDFVLDPMWLAIEENLFEHIDGLKSTCPKPKTY